MTSARERWDRRYRDSAGTLEPAELLLEIEALLPGTGTMVDVAGGSGRNALWFADRGFDVTVIDVSEEGLAHTTSRADARGVVVDCILRDLERDLLPPGRTWDVALMHYFSHRDVLRSLPAALNPGGLLVFAQPTILNLERHERPARRFLMEPGELEDIAADMADIEVIDVSEQWRANGRHEARLLARSLKL